MGMVNRGGRSWEEYEGWLRSPEGQRAARAEEAQRQARVAAGGPEWLSSDGVIQPPSGWSSGQQTSQGNFNAYKPSGSQQQGSYSAYSPSQAQPQQQQSFGTPYNPQKGGNFSMPAWAQNAQVARPQQGGAQQGYRGMQQPTSTAQMPQWANQMPMGGQNWGIPPFQFNATDFMGNQFSSPGAFTAQQGAMAQALNQQRAQGMSQGNFGSLNPQMAYSQGQQMLQGGFQNPFMDPSVLAPQAPPQMWQPPQQWQPPSPRLPEPPMGRRMSEDGWREMFPGTPYPTQNTPEMQALANQGYLFRTVQNPSMSPSVLAPPPPPGGNAPGRGGGQQKTPEQLALEHRFLHGDLSGNAAVRQGIMEANARGEVIPLKKLREGNPATDTVIDGWPQHMRVGAVARNDTAFNSPDPAIQRNAYQREQAAMDRARQATSAMPPGAAQPIRPPQFGTPYNPGQWQPPSPRLPEPLPPGGGGGRSYQDWVNAGRPADPARQWEFSAQVTVPGTDAEGNQVEFSTPAAQANYNWWLSQQPGGQPPGAAQPIQQPQFGTPYNPGQWQPRNMGEPSPMLRGGRAPGYGGRINLPPDSPRRMDWRDADGDGIDDRDQPGPGLVWRHGPPGQQPGGHSSGMTEKELTDSLRSIMSTMHTARMTGDGKVPEGVQQLHRQYSDELNFLRTGRTPEQQRRINAVHSPMPAAEYAKLSDAQLNRVLQDMMAKPAYYWDHALIQENRQRNHQRGLAANDPIALQIEADRRVEQARNAEAAARANVIKANAANSAIRGGSGNTPGVPKMHAVPAKEYKRAKEALALAVREQRFAGDRSPAWVPKQKGSSFGRTLYPGDPGYLEAREGNMKAANKKIAQKKK